MRPRFTRRSCRRPSSATKATMSAMKATIFQRDVPAALAAPSVSCTIAISPGGVVLRTTLMPGRERVGAGAGRQERQRSRGQEREQSSQTHAFIDSSTRARRHRATYYLYPPAASGGLWPLRSLRGQSRYRSFDNWQIDQGREGRRGDRDLPHQMVRAGVVVDKSAEPGAEKRADLMAEERKAEERRAPAQPEHPRHDPRRRRDGREPDDAERRSKYEDRELADRGEHEDHDDCAANRVDRTQEEPLRHPSREIARGVRPEHIRSPDDRQTPCADERREAGSADDRRQMRLHERDEEAEGEAPKAWGTESLADGLTDRLVTRAFERLRRDLREREGERDHRRGGGGEDQECRQPAESVDQDLTDRRDGELAERAARHRDPERDAALLFGDRFADRRQDDRERAAGKTDPEQHAHEVVGERIVPGRHEDERSGVDGRAADNRPYRTETVGEDACYRLTGSPEKVLQCERKREDRAGPVHVVGHRRDEQPETLTDPQVDRQEDAGGHEQPDDHERAASSRLRARRRSASFSNRLRKRIERGVTSTSSSSSMNSIARSSVISSAGGSLTFSSEPAARMFVSFFVRTTLIVTSYSLLLRPTIIPS